MRRHGEYLEFVAPPEARSFRRQDKPLLYTRNGPAILALTRDTAMNRNELYGARIKGGRDECARIASTSTSPPIL